MFPFFSRQINYWEEPLIDVVNWLFINPMLSLKNKKKTEKEMNLY